ncbi:hypothetical protein M9H77_08359 [Catharanthus roseus]|uniref:Uncharacterized protein n=1 Tax=Catharanthus roseus TaxID=4058 RepID=A0ACC0BXQ5_CATRO|nr:hypothetical protein M9H77_08359 [Catharanthus roseus]
MTTPVRILPRTLQYLKEGAKPFLHSGKGRSLSQWESVPTHPSVVDSDSTIETGQSTTLCRFLACRPLATTPMILPLSSIPKRQSTSEELIRPLRISFRYGMLPDGRGAREETKIDFHYCQADLLHNGKVGPCEELDWTR